MQRLRASTASGVGVSHFPGPSLPCSPAPHYEDVRKPSSHFPSTLVWEKAEEQGRPETIQPPVPLFPRLCGWVLSGQPTRMCARELLRLSRPKLLDQRLVQEWGAQMGKQAKTCPQVSTPPLPATPGVGSLPPGVDILSPCPPTPRKGHPHPDRERSFREALKGHVSAARSWSQTKLHSQ